MIRKLAVTVFAVSFAALGCGSDSGTPPKDAAREAAAIDTYVGVEAQPMVPDAGINKDVNPADVNPADVQVAVEVRPTEAGPGVEAGKGEVNQATEAGSVKLDVQLADLHTAEDGGDVDSGTVD